MNLSGHLYGLTFTRSDGGGTVYSGGEFKIVRTEKWNGAITGSITYTWNPFPKSIDPGVEFDCIIESKGNTGNGIGVSVDGTNQCIPEE
jgi:hypothetical protein